VQREIFLFGSKHHAVKKLGRDNQEKSNGTNIATGEWRRIFPGSNQTFEGRKRLETGSRVGIRAVEGGVEQGPLCQIKAGSGKE